jgi:prophage regulatory protein
MEIIGFGKTRVYEMIKAGEFPSPCKPGGSASRWSENEVMAWVADCASQRLH